MASFSSSDHCSVEFDIIHNAKIAQANVSSYDFSKAEKGVLLTLISYML